MHAYVDTSPLHHEDTCNTILSGLVFLYHHPASPCVAYPMFTGLAVFDETTLLDFWGESPVSKLGRCHFSERWGGSGYLRVKGREIPLAHAYRLGFGAVVAKKVWS